MLIDKGIVYAPDFVINAGGLINVAAELEGYNRERVFSEVERIYDRLLYIFGLASKEKTTTQAAAIEMAERRLRDIAGLKSRM